MQNREQSSNAHPGSPPSQRDEADRFVDRLRGAMIGLAVGDALGAPIEFIPPGKFERVDGFRGGGPHGLKPGDWTDDTSMALALADSLASGDWDLNDQAERYLAWWQRGEYSVNGRCFDIGGTTEDALERFSQSRDATKSGDDSEWSSGNGSLMRLAPVAIRFADLFPDKPDQLAELAAQSSLVTHASDQCLSCCRYMMLLMCGLIHGGDRTETLDYYWPPLEEVQEHYPLHAEVREVVRGSYRWKEPPAIIADTYVVRTLEAALWAFHNAESFSEAVLLAVNLGNDADSAGAVCGQIAGAFWGESAIPAEWRAGLAGKPLIDDVLNRLLERSLPSRENVPD